MGWLLKDLNYTNEPFVYGFDCFTEDEIALIEELAAESEEKGDGELERGTLDKNFRKSNISWIHTSEKSEKIYRKLSDQINQINDKFYRFDIFEIETIQYTEYEGSMQGCYKSHSDDGYDFNLFRKLSLSVQLSDPSEYVGGDFLFYRNTISEPSIAPKEKGTIIVFPSFVIHEITPVTQGKRKSLVAWIQGPRFK